MILGAAVGLVEGINILSLKASKIVDSLCVVITGAEVVVVAFRMERVSFSECLGIAVGEVVVVVVTGGAQHSSVVHSLGGLIGYSLASGHI